MGGRFAAHYRDAGIGPYPQEAGIVGPAAHAVVTGTETAANDHRQPRYPATRYSSDQFGAIAGDAAMLIAATNHEAGNVLQKK